MKRLILLCIFSIMVVLAGCNPGEIVIDCIDYYKLVNKKCVYMGSENDAVLLNERLYDFNNQYSDSKVLSAEVSVELSKDLNDIDESVIVQDTMTHYDLSEKYSDEINNLTGDFILFEELEGDLYKHTIAGTNVSSENFSDEFSYDFNEYFGLIPFNELFNGSYTVFYDDECVWLEETQCGFVLQSDGDTLSNILDGYIDNELVDENIEYIITIDYPFDRVTVSFQAYEKINNSDDFRILDIDITFTVGMYFDKIDLTSSEYTHELEDYRDLVGFERTQYEFDVVIDGNSMYLDGSIKYVNDKGSLDEIYLMLYPNAFSYSSDRNIVFSVLNVNGNDVDFNDDSLYSVEGQALKIVLDETSSIGDVIYIDFTYEVDFWNIDRFYHNNGYYVSMFFYPVVAMYDDEGFNLDPYTFSGESYYNDIGDYQVSITTGMEYDVAASGEMVQIDADGSQITRIYEIDDARDFSFSMYDDYHIYTEMYHGKLFEIYSKFALSNQISENVFTYMFYSFEFLEAYIGEYYFDTFTLELGDVYGMESSSIIYCSTEISEITIMHEIVHQYFFSMIGNDQYEETFLDESMTSFITGLLFADFYNDATADEFYYSRYDTSLSKYTERFNSNLNVTLLQNIDDIEDYGFVIYRHGQSILKYYMDEFLNGDRDEMLRIISVYFDEYSKDIAQVEDFVTLMERESGIAGTKDWFMMMLTGLQPLSNRP